MLIKSEGTEVKAEDSNRGLKETSQAKTRFEGFYEEHTIVKETLADNSVSVSVRRSPDPAKNLLYMETDLPGDVIVHWGVCKNDSRNWELPDEPYPLDTIAFKKNALRTRLQVYIYLMVRLFPLSV